MNANYQVDGKKATDLLSTGKITTNTQVTSTNAICQFRTRPLISLGPRTAGYRLGSTVQGVTLQPDFAKSGYGAKASAAFCGFKQIATIMAVEGIFSTMTIPDEEVSMTTQPNKTALITGASGGIGYDLAKEFASNGYHVVLVARSKEKLEQLAQALAAKYSVKATVIAQDLGAIGAPQEIFNQLEKAGITVDALINNAGFASYGFFHELDTQKELDMIQLNVMALVHLTRLFLPGMVQRKNGKILNVASTAAFQPGPLMAVYYATKAFVLSFSEAIANELEGTGVTVTALCPGPTESGFQARAAMQDSKLVQSGMMDSMTVAKAGYEGLTQGKTVVIPGLFNKIGALAPRFTPRKLTARVVRTMQERRGH